MKPKKPQDRTKKVGKATGYELRDGKYFVAPVYRQQFEDFQDRVEGIQGLVNVVNAFASEELARLARTKRKLWDTLEDDYGVKFPAGSGWAYNFSEHCLFLQEKQPEKKSAEKP